MSSVLIVGATRGIGLECVRQFQADGHPVLATHRSIGDADRLAALGATPIELDMLDERSIARLPGQLNGQQLALAMIVAGVNTRQDPLMAEPPAQAEFDRVMRTNVLAPMRLVPAIAPFLRQGATLAMLTSDLGSLELASQMGSALYRASKAAENMIARLAHAHLSERGVRVLALHPGWVQTEMGGDQAEIDVATSVQGIRRVIDDAATFPAGGFFDYRGDRLPW